MDFRIQEIKQCKDEIAALIKLYYEDKTLLDGLPEIEMDWAHYDALAGSKMLLLVTCREDEKLIGCVLYVILPHPHYKGRKWAYCDTLAVDPSFRRKRIGTTLIEAAMLKLRERGVQFVTNNYRTVYNTEPLFPKLGFKLMEHCYIKELT